MRRLFSYSLVGIAVGWLVISSRSGRPPDKGNELPKGAVTLSDAGARHSVVTISNRTDAPIEIPVIAGETLSMRIEVSNGNKVFRLTERITWDSRHTALYPMLYTRIEVDESKTWRVTLAKNCIFDGNLESYNDLAHSLKTGETRVRLIVDIIENKHVETLAGEWAPIDPRIVEHWIFRYSG